MVPFFATFLSAFVVVTTLDSGHSNWGEMKSQCCFDLYLFYNREGEHFFMYLLAISTSSFENSLFHSCAHFFMGVLVL
jgi:hypothetical protein